MPHHVCISCRRVHTTEKRRAVPVDGGHTTCCPFCPEQFFRDYGRSRIRQILHRTDGSAVECVRMAQPTTTLKAATNG